MKLELIGLLLLVAVTLGLQVDEHGLPLPLIRKLQNPLNSGVMEDYPESDFLFFFWYYADGPMFIQNATVLDLEDYSIGCEMKCLLSSMTLSGISDETFRSSCSDKISHMTQKCIEIRKCNQSISFMPQWQQKCATDTKFSNQEAFHLFGFKEDTVDPVIDGKIATLKKPEWPGIDDLIELIKEFEDSADIKESHGLSAEALGNLSDVQGGSSPLTKDADQISLKTLISDSNQSPKSTESLSQSSGTLHLNSKTASADQQEQVSDVSFGEPISTDPGHIINKSQHAVHTPEKLGASPSDVHQDANENQRKLEKCSLNCYFRTQKCKSTCLELCASKQTCTQNCVNSCADEWCSTDNLEKCMD